MVWILGPHQSIEMKIVKILDVKYNEIIPKLAWSIKWSKQIRWVSSFNRGYLTLRRGVVNKRTIALKAFDGAETQITAAENADELCVGWDRAPDMEMWDHMLGGINRN